MFHLVAEHSRSYGINLLSLRDKTQIQVEATSG
jgi:hypothetical protein